MEAEAEVGFVVAHAECGGGDDGFQFIVTQLLLDQQSVGGVHLSGVSRDIEAGLLQEGSESFGFSDSEGVDDAGTWQSTEGIGCPCIAFGGGQSGDDGQSE